MAQPDVESHHGGFLIGTRLVQADWDFPSEASRLGWSLRRVQAGRTVPCTRCHELGLMDGRPCFVCRGAGSMITARVLRRAPNRGHGCDHRGTDGTVDCPQCGVRASQFISAAGEFLAELC